MKRKRTNLIKLLTVPKMFEGRVIIVIDGKAKDFAVGKYCSLKHRWDATFDPANYELLETDDYDCIIDVYGQYYSNSRKLRIKNHVVKHLPVQYCTGMPWACGCDYCEGVRRIM